MPDGLGSLFSHATSSFNQGRSYNLAVANARANAAMRIKQMQQEDERRALEAERNQFYIDKFNEEKRQAEYERKQAEKLRKETMDYATDIAETVFPGQSGRDVTAEVSAGRPADYKTMEKKTSAGRAAVMLAPKEAAETIQKQFLQPSGRKIGHLPTGKYGYTDEQGVVHVTGEIGGSGKAGGLTEFERIVPQFLDPNTPENVKELYGKRIQRLLGETGNDIDGATLNEISRLLNDLYPVDLGDRDNVPEGIDPNSIDFIKHGAMLLKQLRGESVGEGETGENPYIIETE